MRLFLAPIGSKDGALVEDGGKATSVLELVLVDGKDLGMIVQRGCNEVRSPSSLRIDAGDVGARRSARQPESRANVEPGVPRSRVSLIRKSVTIQGAR